MADQIIKTQIKLDGTAAYQRALKTINDDLKILANQTKTVSNSFDKSQASLKNFTDLNSALGKQIDGQKSKIATLKEIVSQCTTKYNEQSAKLKDVARNYGENSEQAKQQATKVQSAQDAIQKYTKMLTAAEAALSKMEKEYNSNSEAIAKLSASEKDATTQVENLSGKTKQASVQAKAADIAFSALKNSISLAATAMKNISSATIKAVTADVELSTNAFVEYNKQVAKAAVEIGKASYATGSSFEKEMSAVQAYSELNKHSVDFQKLNEAAKQAGATTSRTATEVAQGLEFMALADYDVKEMLEGLNPLVYSTEAGLMDMATASDLITDNLAVLGLGAKDMAKYLDIVTAAQNNSNTSMQQFLEAIIPVGGTMKELNVPTEEMATLLGILANRGNKSSEAGHKLNSVLVNLIGANKNADTALTELGISAWNSDGTFKGITETLLELDKALQTVSDEEKVQFEVAIGGKLQMDTLQKLIAGVKDEYNELYEAVSNSDGVLEKTAETMRDNVAGSVEILKSAIDSLKNEAFEDFSSTLKNAVDDASYYIGLLSTAFQSGGIEGATKFFATRLKKGVDESISEMLPTILTGYEKFQKSYDTIFLSIIDSASKILPQSTEKVLQIMTDSFQNVTQGLVPYAQPALETLLNVFTNGLPSIITSMNTALASAINTINLPELIKTGAENISNQVPIMIDSGIELINALLDGIGTIFNSEELGETASQLIVHLGNGIMQVVGNIIPVANSIINTLLTAIVEYAPSLFQGASDIITLLLNGLIENIPILAQAAVVLIMGLVGLIADNIEPLVNAAVQLVSYLAKELVTEDNLQLLLSAAVKIVNGLLDGIVESLPILLKAVNSILASFIMFIVNPETWAKVINLVVNAIADVISVFLEAGGAIFDLLTEIADKGLNLFIEFLRPGKFKEIGEGIWEGVEDGLETGVNYLKDKIDGVGKLIPTWLKEALGIGSPSKVVEQEVGVWITPGIVEGVEDTQYQLTDGIDDAISNAINDIDRDVSARPTITFATDIDDFNSQLEELKKTETTFSFFSDTPDEELNSIFNANIDNSTQFDALEKRLESIENLLENMKFTAAIHNYLYPNSTELRRTFIEIGMENNAITGGR